MMEVGCPSTFIDWIERSSPRLWRLARRRIPAFLRSRFGPEDVVQSVYRTFFRRYQAGQFGVRTGDDLDGLLTVFTLRKCASYFTHHMAMARTPLLEVPIAPDRVSEWTDLAREAAIAEVVTRTVEGFTSTQQAVLGLTLEGCSARRIAIELETPIRTIHRIRKRFLSRLLDAFAPESECFNARP